jgi:glycosyltransferase involved in cell wall biosynthesis
MLFEPPFEVMVSGPVLDALRSELARTSWTGYDLVQVEHSMLGVLRQDIPATVPCALDSVDVPSSLRKRQWENLPRSRRRVAEWTEWLKTSRYERRTFRGFDALLACSELDRDRLAALAPSVPCSVVPNGVDAEYFARPPDVRPDDDTLLFVGTMSYRPNAEAILWFANEVFPELLRSRPETRLFIVGRDPPAEVAQLGGMWPGRIVVTGGVEDVRPYMTRSSTGIVPLLNGGGTRLKILEMLSMQMPVVSTSVGAEGISVTHERDILLADSPGAFVSSLTALAETPSLRKFLGMNGRRLVESRYSWEQAADTVDHVWRSLATRESA